MGGVGQGAHDSRSHTEFDQAMGEPTYGYNFLNWNVSDSSGGNRFEVDLRWLMSLAGTKDIPTGGSLRSLPPMTEAELELLESAGIITIGRDSLGNIESVQTTKVGETLEGMDPPMSFDDAVGELRALYPEGGELTAQDLKEIVDSNTARAA